MVFTREQVSTGAVQQLPGSLDIPIALPTAGNLLVAGTFSRDGAEPALPLEGFYDDFADGLSKWTDLSDAGGSYAINTGQLELTQTAGDTPRAQATGLSHTDVEVTGLHDMGTSEFVIAIRSDGTYTAGSDTPDNGYTLHLDSDGSTTMLVFEHDAGTPTQIGSSTHQSTGQQRFRFRSDGTSIEAKAWTDGTDEPTTWDISVTNSVVTGPGSIELTAAINGTVRADEIAIFDLAQTSEWTIGLSLFDSGPSDYLMSWYKEADGDERIIRMNGDELTPGTGDYGAGWVAEYSGFNGTPTLDQTASTAAAATIDTISSGTTGTLADATSLAIASFSARDWADATSNAFTSYTNSFTEIVDLGDGTIGGDWAHIAVAELETASTAAVETTATPNETGIRMAGQIIIFYDPNPGPTASLFATGDGTITNVVDETNGTTNIWESIDDDPATPTDTDWINNATDTASTFIDLTNLPVNFGTMDTAEIVVRTRGQEFGTGTVTLYAQLFQSDESTSLSDEVQVDLSTANESFANQTAVAFTNLNTTASKAVWDAAKVRFRWATT